MIWNFVLVAVIQILVFSGFTNGQQNEKYTVDVVVYYETLCPFARNFTVDQLGPFLQGDLSTYITLTLIPYGKATTDLKNDTYEFSCHHGEAECYGNKLQACALVLLNNGLNTTDLGFNREAVEFIICLMKDLNFKSSIAEVQAASKKCIVTEKYNLLTKCANGILGPQYLAHLGNLTDHFQKPLGNVPTIVFDGVFRKKESDQSEKNFKELFCSKIKLKNLTACQEAVVSTTTSQIPSTTPESSIGPTILPIPQLSLGITILAFLGILLGNDY